MTAARPVERRLFFMLKHLRYVSLFSGLGSADVGFDAAGLECVGQVELDPVCQAVLAHWWPDVPRWGDITTVSGAELPPADVVVWGSPCQNLSIAGGRAGLAGSESGLFFEGLRVIREMREASGGRFPIVSVWENVPGALSSNGGADYGAVLDGLAGIGAVDIAWRVINCEHWAPQRRRRVFVVACFPPYADGHPGAAGGRAAEILSLTEGVQRHPAKGRKARERIAGSLGGGTTGDGPKPDTDRTTFVAVPAPAVSMTLNAHGGSGRLDAESETLLPMAFDWQSGGDVRHNVSSQHTSALQASQVPAVFQPQGFHENLSASVTMADTAKALRSGASKSYQGVTSGMAVRRLTPLECSRLQSLPDAHLQEPRYKGKPITDSAKYRMLGNAMNSSVMRWIGQRLMEHIKGGPEGS